MSPKAGVDRQEGIVPTLRQPSINTFWLVLREMDDSSRLCSTYRAVSSEVLGLTWAAFWNVVRCESKVNKLGRVLDRVSCAGPCVV